MVNNLCQANHRKPHAKTQQASNISDEIICCDLYIPYHTINKRIREKMLIATRLSLEYFMTASSTLHLSQVQLGRFDRIKGHCLLSQALSRLIFFMTSSVSHRCGYISSRGFRRDPSHFSSNLFATMQNSL